VSYGFTSLLVSDAASTALLEYATALNRSNSAAMVELPAIDAVGCSAPVQILLAPGIPLLSEEAPDDLLEPDDVAFVTEVHRKAAALQQVQR
jgi:hypothetical protein